LLLALASVACARGAASPPARARPSAARPLELSPRWFLTERATVTVDEGASEGLEARKVLGDGTRLELRGGEIIAAVPWRERLSGFRALPDRLGAGYVFWSGAGTFTAPSFDAELGPIVDAPSSGGARPWLDGVLLRTEAGLLLLDPKSRAVRRFDVAGVADAFAIDGQRAARLDLLGRASVTTDGGATWLDLEATRRELVDALRPFEPAGLRLHTMSGGFLELGARGDLHPQPATPRPPRLFTATRPIAPPVRGLASARLADAVLSGAPLDDRGDRALVGFDGRVAVVSLASGAVVEERDLPPPDGGATSKCQPLRLDDQIVVACELAGHARVYALRDTFFELEASFDGGGPFVFGGRDHFGHVGPCGAGLRARSPAAPDEDETPVDHPAKALEPTAKYCARLPGGTWIERGLGGVLATKILRWTPGADGGVTALALAAELVDPPAAPSGVRLIRVRSTDDKLDAAAFRARAALIDVDASSEDDGAVRTWLATSSGVFASARIDATGAIKKAPAPDGVTKMGVRGPFALATVPAHGDRAARTLASRDFGATYQEIAPPPGLLEAFRADPSGCSDLGCAWESGLVRVGIGPPAALPIAVAPSQRAPASAPGPKPRFQGLRLACNPSGDQREHGGVADPKRPVRMSLTSSYASHPGAVLSIAPPLDPEAPPRAVSLPPQLAETAMAAPVLAPRGIDLLLFGHDRAIRTGTASSSPWVFDGEGRTSIAAEVGAALVVFDADRALVQIARPTGVAVVSRLVQIPSFDRTRLTLGRRRDGGVSVVGYSVSTGDLWAAALDLGRGDVAPIAALASLSRGADASRCRVGPDALALILDLPITLALDGARTSEASARAAVLVSADREHVCVEALEALGAGDRVVARFAPRASSSLEHDGGPPKRMSCALSTELAPPR
jgi:hypothetical protein